MRKPTRKIVAALAATAAIGGAVLAGPVVATAQEADTAEGVEAPAPGGHIAEALDQLVADGVISRAQADAVAEALAAARPTRGHFGHRGRHLAAVAEMLGVEATDLVAALQDGATIADVAADNDVDVQTVIDGLVGQLSERLDEAVAEGRLTAEAADDKLAEATERIEAMINGELSFAGPRRGGRGFGPRGGFGPRPGADAEGAGFSV